MPQELFKRAYELYKRGNPAEPNDVTYDEALELLANVIDKGDYTIFLWIEAKITPL